MNRLVGGLVLALCASCAPLQQAPLLYSSTSAVGIDLSATTTESPGMSIALGYKSVDAAYVPVAVAKPCESPDKQKCEEHTYQLVQISGSNEAKQGNENRDARAKAQKLIDSFNAAKSDLKAKQLDLTATKAAYDRALDAEFAKQKLFSDLGNKNENELTASEKTLLESKTKTLEQMKQTTNETREAYNAAKEAAAKAQEAVNAFNAQQISDAYATVQGSENKQDAFSVFGSFDAKTSVSANGQGQANGPGPEGSIILGKVFSTGVASQFLTQGLRDYYGGIAIAKAQQATADCLAKAAAFKDASGSEALIKTALDLCVKGASPKGSEPQAAQNK